MKYLSKLLLFSSVLLVSGFFITPALALISGSVYSTDLIYFNCVTATFVQGWLPTEHDGASWFNMWCSDDGKYPWTATFSGLTPPVTYDLLGLPGYCPGSYQNCIDINLGEPIEISQVIVNSPPSPPTTGGGWIVNLPTKEGVIASLSLATIGIYGDMSPVAMIVIGIMLGLGLLIWAIARFRYKGATDA